MDGKVTKIINGYTLEVGSNNGGIYVSENRILCDLKKHDSHELKEWMIFNLLGQAVYVDGPIYDSEILYNNKNVITLAMDALLNPCFM